MDAFKFFLYRLNKEFRCDLFSSTAGSYPNDDACLREFFAQICSEQFDFKKETLGSIYIWSLRNFQHHDNNISSLVLARGQHKRTSTIVTPDSLIVGESISYPPPADTIVLLILWDRHIVVIENRAGMTTGEVWLRNFHSIVDNAMLRINVPIAPRLEPIPVKGTILHHLRNLDKVFRFRVRLKMPNPELNRWAERIYEEMVQENLTEYLQEFVSPAGIRVDDDSKAISSAALAELGYKEGGVRIEGEKDGRSIEIEEGKTAITGKVEQMKALIRGLETNSSGKNLNNALAVISAEVDRLFPNES